MRKLLPMSKQPSIRINLSAKHKLDRMQQHTNLSQPALLDLAISLLDRKLEAQQLANDFAFLADSADALKQYNSVAEIFEGASGDSLSNE